MEKGEKTLVKRAMRGNPKAFGTLVEREQEYLYRMAFLYVRQEQDALDVVQESILKAYKSLKTLREPEYFRTWLTKIVINTAQDTLRARQRTAPLEEELDLPAPEGLPPEERMDLHGAIARLPEKYQDVIKLKYFDGYTIREISEATGMGATVKLKTRTIPVIGTTEERASITFSFSFLFIDASFPSKS